MTSIVINHHTTYGQIPTLEPLPSGLPTLEPQPSGIPTLEPLPSGLPTLQPVPSGVPTLEPLPSGIPTLPPAPGGASVFGFVTDPDENELEGVVVTINGFNYSGETWSDEDGFFQFENVPAGDYTVTFEFEDYQTQTQNISITEGQTEVDLDVIIMEPIVIAAISGSVIDINGEPLESVKVKLKGIKTKFIEVVYTDANGFFEFTDLEADTYIIIANKKGYKRKRQRVKLGEGQQEEVEIVLKRTN